MARTYMRMPAPPILIGILIASSLTVAAAVDRREVRSLVRTQAGATLIAESARPIATAVEALVSEYGYVITYEDPRYIYDDDLVDVTTQVRKDLAKYPPGMAPKVVGPKGGRLELNITEPTSVDDVERVLNQIVQTKVDSGRGGHFRSLRTGNVFHIVPTEVRDQNGNWSTVASVLDAPISLPAQEQTDSEMIKVICDAVTKAAHVQVNLGWTGLSGGVGIGPVGGRQSHRYPLRAENEPARQVLMRALDEIAADRSRLTWVLLYDRAPTNSYYLSLIPVPLKQPPSTKTKPTVSGPTDVPEHRPTDVR